MSGSGNGTTGSKKAYLILGLNGVGKTTFGRKRAWDEGGLCLSIDEFFYTMVNPDHPNEYSFREDRAKSASRWFWMELKKCCDKGISPLYLDKPHSFAYHTISTVAFLELRYGYDVELVEPDSVIWQQIRSLLNDKDKNVKDLEYWAKRLSDEHRCPYVTFKKIINDMDEWSEFTITDLMAEY